MENQPHKIALWWIRRDLRLTDNQALSAALEYASVVIPVFILDAALFTSSTVSAKRRDFMVEGLRRLDETLRVRASYLVVRKGNPVQEICKLVAETKASMVFAEEDYSPYARQRDTKVAEMVPFRLMPGLTVHHPRAVVKNDGRPYTVFTPFSKAWKSLPPPFKMLPAPQRIATPMGIPSDELPAENTDIHVHYPAGEAEANQRLANFIRGPHPRVHDYHLRRDRPDLNATSSLSPYLRFGMLSPRHAVIAAIKIMQLAPSAASRQGVESWLNELIWREFFQAILYHFPQVHEGSFRKDLQNIRWENDPAMFQAWCAGGTGYPIVDAAMRQLVQTGWMHNRARMIVASFLTKDLLIDWQWGEKWFMQHLVDGDVAANNGGWQWAAGTGTDAAPYFRVFNPILQGQKFDPHGTYIRTWLPELREVPEKFIHTPWEMPLAEQHRHGVVIGTHYPAPIIDHTWARERTLEAYALAQKEATENK
ncbi:MAG: deoxyribodipyrimidine photo-lyase [Anaerolineales bacterium]|nr:deoxyribodipyrimidine photo-lyase [Anaerolineales bacterium]